MCVKRLSIGVFGTSLKCLSPPSNASCYLEFFFVQKHNLSKAVKKGYKITTPQKPKTISCNLLQNHQQKQRAPKKDLKTANKNKSRNKETSNKKNINLLKKREHQKHMFFKKKQILKTLPQMLTKCFRAPLCRSLRR